MIQCASFRIPIFRERSSPFLLRWLYYVGRELCSLPILATNIPAGTSASVTFYTRDRDVGARSNRARKSLFVLAQIPGRVNLAGRGDATGNDIQVHE